MSELFGPLPRHAIAGVPLGIAVLAPLVGAGLAALGPGQGERSPSPRRTPADLIVAVAAAVSALVALSALVSALRSPSGLVVSPVWTLVRTGSIDASLGFDADVGRSALALVVALGGAFIAWRGDTGDRARSTVGLRGARAGWRGLAIAAALAALLADGLGTAFLALGAALVATGAGAIRGRWAPGAASLLALALAGATLAWGLEGRWLEGLSGNYLSDYQARFAAVRDAPPDAPRARGPVAEPKGSITMTSVAGAEVYVGAADEASLRGRAPLAVAPFVKAPVTATLQRIAVVPGGGAIVGGDGLEIALTDNVDIRADDDVVVTPIGATWTWRDLESQLLVHELDGKHPLRSALTQKQLAAMTLPTAVLLLAFVAAALAWLDGPRRVARAIEVVGPLEASLVAGALAVASLAPAARLAALVPLAGAAPLLVVAVACVAFGAVVASSRGGWLSAGVATALAGAALLSVAADAPPMLALGLALLAAATPRFAEAAARRAPHPWIGGPDEDDPSPEPVVPPTPAPSAEPAPAPAGEPAVSTATKKKKNASKKAAEARS